MPPLDRDGGRSAARADGLVRLRGESARCRADPNRRVLCRRAVAHLADGGPELVAPLLELADGADAGLARRLAVLAGHPARRCGRASSRRRWSGPTRACRTGPAGATTPEDPALRGAFPLHRGGLVGILRGRCPDRRPALVPAIDPTPRRHAPASGGRASEAAARVDRGRAGRSQGPAARDAHRLPRMGRHQPVADPGAGPRCGPLRGGAPAGGAWNF